jgi:cell division septation protein DedD
VRCGPQTQPHVTIKDGPPSPDATYYTYNGNPRGVSHTTGQVRVAPKHVYENQLASTDGIYVPEGYQLVWEDDRLNPYRAHQTLAGKAQMDQVWTTRVPRTLKPGVVSGSYVSYAAGGVPDDTQPPAPEVSRSAPLTSSVALSDTSRPASHRYVQIGAFSDPSTARQTAQRLANSGLPAKLGKHTQGGKSYTLVLVGPFATQSGLDSGFAQVRGMGYASASLKR